jgi:hypothetical protein
MATVAEECVPPLAFGDKLTRDEFLRIWEAHPRIKFAELLGGIVFMPSPVSTEHGDMESALGGWLYTYQAATTGIASGHNTTTFILDDTPQPDLNMRILPEYGGSSRIERGYLAGVPELLAEICRSSASYDLHVKFDLYETARVPEYLAVLVYEGEIRWHVLENERYVVMPPDADGVLRSKIFPGLWLDGKALLAGNSGQVLNRLQQGINSPEHERFVAGLATRKRA